MKNTIVEFWYKDLYHKVVFCGPKWESIEVYLEDDSEIYPVSDAFKDALRDACFDLWCAAKNLTG